jgi:hypothetical protein
MNITYFASVTLKQAAWPLIRRPPVKTFSLALVTLFHITAGEPWPEEPSLFDEDGTVNWKVCSFHMAYELTVNWVILQARIPLMQTHCWLEQGESLCCTVINARAQRR